MNTPSLFLSALPAFLAASMVCAMPARAATIYSESFDYGPAAGSLDGQNGGTGFAGAWHFAGGTNANIYTPAGLSFSDLSVSGGMVTGPATANYFSKFDRALASPLSGVYYGSFLSQIQSGPSGLGQAALSLGGSGGGILGNDRFGVYAPVGSHALQVNSGIAATFTGSPQFIGQTYLTLFKVDTASLGISGWVLSAAQYDTFKVGGITEAELNAASTGTGSGTVWARAGAGSFFSGGALAYLNMLVSPTGTITNLDECRLSNASLNEAVPATVPEPGAGLLLLLGLALFAPARRGGSTS